MQPQTGAPFKLTDLGWYHPAGPRYVASMYRDPKTGVLYGAGYQSSDGGRSFELVAREPAGKVRVSPLPYGASPTWPHAALLYGSMTADASGRFYFVGTMNYKPVVLQITVAGT